MDFAESKSPPWHSAVTLMWRSHPWLTLGTVLTGLLSGVASIVGVGLISRALHDPDERRTLLLVFIAVNVVAIVCRSGAAVMPSYACMKLMTRLRVNLCKRILATPLDEIDRRGAPNVLTLLTQDIPQLSQTLLTIPTIIVQSVVLICSIVYLAYLSWIVFASTMVLTIVGLALYLFFYRRAVNFTERVRDEFVRFNEYTHGLVFGIKELKLNRARRRWFTRAAIELSSKRVAGFNYIERFWFMGGDTIGQITVAVLLGFLLFGVPSLGVVDPSVLTATILAVLYMMGPLTMLINILPMVAEGKTALARLAEFGFLVDDTQVSPADRSPERAPESSSAGAWRVIELKGVKMNYRDSESTTDFVLGPIDMTIHAGELVYVIGGNGSGKSTLGKVLSGLYAPTEGHIALDGAVVDDDARERYRKPVLRRLHRFPSVRPRDRPRSRGRRHRACAPIPRDAEAGRQDQDRRQALLDDDRAVDRATQAARAALRVHRGSPDLYPRRMGRRSGPRFQAVFLRGAGARPASARQVRRHHHA